MKATDVPNGRQLLPEINGELVAGDVRALEMPGLASMHTLFLREHNRIAQELAFLDDDDEIFELTRRIVGAEMQNIVYNEYLPALLGVDAMKKFGILLDASGPRTEYDPKINPSIANVFATAAYRFGHSMIQGLIKVISNSGSDRLESSSISNGFVNLIPCGTASN